GERGRCARPGGRCPSALGGLRLTAVPSARVPTVIRFFSNRPWVLDRSSATTSSVSSATPCAASPFVTKAASFRMEGAALAISPPLPGAARGEQAGHCSRGGARGGRRTRPGGGQLGLAQDERSGGAAGSGTGAAGRGPWRGGNATARGLL